MYPRPMACYVIPPGQLSASNQDSFVQIVVFEVIALGAVDYSGEDLEPIGTIME
jgi:hypothetical protein